MTIGPIDISEVRRKHARASDEIRKLVSQAAAMAGGDAVTFSRENHDYKNRSGALERSTFARVVMLKRQARVTIKNTRSYAASIDMGARPHWIKPRALDKPLRFRIGGRWVSTWLVKHPGNRAYRFLFRSIKHGHRMFPKRFTEGFAAVARKF